MVLLVVRIIIAILQSPEMPERRTCTEEIRSAYGHADVDDTPKGAGLLAEPVHRHFRHQPVDGVGLAGRSHVRSSPHSSARVARLFSANSGPWWLLP